MRKLFGSIIVLMIICAGWPSASAQNTDQVLGTTQAALTAHTEATTSQACVIAAGETLLAIGQNPDNILVYAGGIGCEGPVWIARIDEANITWEDAARLATLPEITPSANWLTSVFQPLTERDFGDEYTTICENATQRSAPPDDPNPTLYVGDPARFLERYPTYAINREELDIVVCWEIQSTTLKRCPYSGNNVLELTRLDLVIKLVNYQTGGVFATQAFNGENPSLTCPQTHSFAVIPGGTTDYLSGPFSVNLTDEAVGAWVYDTIGGQTGTSSRTVVNTPTLNARSQPNTSSEILTQLPKGTPVNLIGRDESGAWVVALLPDMSKGWLYLEYLKVAGQTDAANLPIFSGNAAEAPITLGAPSSDVAQTTTDAPPSSTIHELVYTAWDVTGPAGEDIYLVSLDGTAPQLLTAFTGDSSSPMWSPDGSQIAFISTYRHEGDDGIYLMGADGSNPQLITSPEVFRAYDISYVRSLGWSPDGNNISFVVALPGATNASLYTINANGLTDLSDESVVIYVNPAWSPDSSRIAFGTVFDLFVMNADGSNVQSLVHRGVNFGEIQWSPDGNQIVFVSFKDKNNDIYIINADGSNLVNLTQAEGNDFSPVWSPDGSQIAFVSDREDPTCSAFNCNWEIYVMNADGSNLRNLTNSAGADFVPMWSPDGKYIAFVTYRDGAACNDITTCNSEIYVMNADGSEPRNLSQDEKYNMGPEWRP